MSTTPYINLTTCNGQEGPPKNNLGIGVFSYIKNYKVIKHIEITHFDGDILLNSQRVFHKTIR